MTFRLIEAEKAEHAISRLCVALSDRTPLLAATATGEFRLGFVYIDSFTGPTLFQLVIVTVTP